MVVVPKNRSSSFSCQGLLLRITWSCSSAHDHRCSGVSSPVPQSRHIGSIVLGLNCLTGSTIHLCLFNQPCPVRNWIYRLSRQVCVWGPPSWGVGGLCWVWVLPIFRNLIPLSFWGYVEIFCPSAKNVSNFAPKKIGIFADFQCYTLWVTYLHCYLRRRHFNLSEPILT